MLLKTAQQWATDITEQLMPLCDRVAIAGSIRRHCALCGDIDLVAQCTFRQRRAVRDRCLRSHPQIRSDGEHILSFVLGNGVKIQVFFARPQEQDLFNVRPANWGSIMLCRTGCADFNRYIALRASKFGCHWDPFRGIMQGDIVIASESEEAIFEAIRIRPVDPVRRSNVRLPEVAA